MKVFAVHQIKGGVGKTTTVVNLAWLAAAEGRRVVLWDLDPQAASTWTLRIRERVEGRMDGILSEARRGTGPWSSLRASDYAGLDVLPGDVSYRGMEQRLAACASDANPLADVLAALAPEYDLALLDCPPGLTTVAERVFDVADALVIPTLPTPLSLRTLSQLMKHLKRLERRPSALPFFSMVDRRKRIHTDTCRYAEEQALGFLRTTIPYASLVEQMALRREPLPAFAPNSPAARSHAELWTEIGARVALGERGSILARRGARRELRQIARGRHELGRNGHGGARR